MKIFLILAAILFIVVGAVGASVGYFVMMGPPDWVSQPVMTRMMKRIEDKFLDSEQQVQDSLPFLGQLGYEVTSFKVVAGGWGLLPW